jgi:hypothetical protein
MKTLYLALLLGLFGAVAVATSLALQWPTWVLFIAWVSYYMFGRSLKSSAIVLVQMICGIILGILIQLTSAWLHAYIGKLALPLAVFFFIGSLAYTTRIQSLNSMPAWFLGLIIFFGVHPLLAPMPVLNLLFPLVAGFLFAWLNDSTIQGLLHKREKKHLTV